MKKYQAVQKDIMALFDEALPHFKKAESINPNDMNTLIALSEIFARKEDVENATELKKRLDVLKGGGKNESSFFKQ